MGSGQGLWLLGLSGQKDLYPSSRTGFPWNSHGGGAGPFLPGPGLFGARLCQERDISETAWRPGRLPQLQSPHGPLVHACFGCAGQGVGLALGGGLCRHLEPHHLCHLCQRQTERPDQEMACSRGHSSPAGMVRRVARRLDRSTPPASQVLEKIIPNRLCRHRPHSSICCL